MDQILFILRTEIEGENILETLRTCMLLVKIEWRGKRRFSKTKQNKKNISMMGLIRDQHLCQKVHNLY